MKGSEHNDEIVLKDGRPVTKNNFSGGILGGISNGEDIILRACMKPISTLMNPLPSVNINTKRASKAAVERTDTCVVEAAGVVTESAVAFVLAGELLEKFGCDSLKDIKENYKIYLKRVS